MHALSFKIAVISFFLKKILKRSIFLAVAAVSMPSTTPENTRDTQVTFQKQNQLQYQQLFTNQQMKTFTPAKVRRSSTTEPQQ